MKYNGLLASRAAPPVATLASVVVVWAANAFGLWWVTLLVGAALGLLLRGTRRMLAAAALAGLSGWGLPLLWQALHLDLGATATVVAEIMGFGSSGFVVVLLALVFGLLLSLAGAWLGTALRRAVGAFVGQEAAPVAVQSAAVPASGGNGEASGQGEGAS
jgi:hypothetical protein